MHIKNRFLRRRLGIGMLGSVAFSGLLLASACTATTTSSQPGPSSQPETSTPAVTGSSPSVTTTDAVAPSPDSAAPVVAVLQPADGATIGGNALIAVEATDDSGIGAVQYMIEGLHSEWLPLEHDGATTRYFRNLSTAGARDGDYRLLLRVEDTRGNLSESSLKFVVDNPPTAPTGLTVEKPSSPDNGGSVILAWAPNSEADLTGYNVYRRLESSESTYELVAHVDQPGFVDEGVTNGATYQYIVRAIDRANNESGVALDSFTVATPRDTKLPSVTKVTAANPTTSGVNIAVAADEPVLVQLEYGLEQGPTSLIEVGGNALPAATITLDKLQNGAVYVYRLHLVDRAGNKTTSETFKFRTLADNPPAVTVTKPGNRVAVGGTISLLVNASDDWAVKKVDFAIEDGPFAPMVPGRGEGDFEATLDTTDLVDGEYTIHARAEDDAGQVTVVPIVLRIDNLPPLPVNVRVTELARLSALVVWTTDEPATARVEFGKTSALGLGASQGNGLDSTHQVEITGLTAATQYFYRIRSVDAAGNETVSDTLTFQTPADNRPTVEILFPQTGNDLAGLTSLQVKAVDDWKVAKVEYSVGGGFSVLQKSAEADGYFTIVDTKKFSTGLYMVTVRATDDAGQVAEAKAEVRFDNMKPIISGVFAIGRSRDQGTVTWNTNEPTGAAIEYGLTSALGSTINVQTVPSTFHEAAVAGLLPNTTYYFRVRSTDRAGNVTLGTIGNFTTMEDSGPTVSILTPATAGSLVNQTLTVKASATDDWSQPVVEVAFDNGTFSRLPHNGTPNTFEGNLSTAGLSVGQHRLVVRAIDDMGTIAVTEINLQVDNVAPSLLDLEVQIVDSMRVEIIGTSDELSKFRLDYGLTEALGTTKIVDTLDTTHTISVDQLEPSTTYFFRARAIDAAGNICQCQVFSFTTPADVAPTAGIVGPVKQPVLFLDSVVTLAVAAQDDWGISAVEYSVDGGAFQPLTKNAQTGNYEAAVDTRTLTEGAHSIAIQAADARAQTAADLIDFVVDNLAPAVTFEGLVDPIIVDGTRSFQFQASDANGLTGVEYALDGGAFQELIANPDTGMYEITVDSSTLAGGAHTLIARAGSVPGKITEAPITLFVDNVGPTASFVGLNDQPIMSGVVTLQVQAQDDWGIGSVQYTVDGSAPKLMSLNATTGLYEASLNTTSFIDGAHVVSVLATDNAGKNAPSVEVAATLDNGAPSFLLVTPSPAGAMLEAGLPNEIHVSASDATSGVATVEIQTVFPPAGFITAFTGLEIFAPVPTNLSTLHPNPKIDATEIPAGLPEPGLVVVVFPGGIVEAVDAATGEWQIRAGDQSYFVYTNPSTVMLATGQVGEVVKVVAFRTLTPGPIVAEVIRTRSAFVNTAEFLYVYTGVIESMGDHLWKIGGAEFVLDDPVLGFAVVEGAFQVGDTVTVEYAVPAQALPPTPDPALWQAVTQNTISGLWSSLWTGPSTVLDTLGWLFVRVTDAAGHVTQSVFQSSLVTAGRTFQTVGPTGQTLTGKVTIEPVGQTKPNRIGIEFHGTGLEPLGTYTIEVSDGTSTVAVSFMAGRLGTGTVLFEADTDIADEFTATLTFSGPGF